MKQSVFDIYGVDKIFEGENVEDTIFLDINFRNHPDITKLASDLFYNGMLKSGKDETSSKSLYILNTKTQMTPAEGGSFLNHGNSYLVFEQVKKALTKGRRSIGVITPFKEQAKLINQSFNPLRKIYPDADIQAGTVHKFQGKEKDVIIFDLCFSVHSQNVRIPKAYDGDIKSETAKLLNVAMTRAQSFFILVGDVEGIKLLNQNNLVLKDWIDGIEKLKS
jgi:superfamily I DNA and/or RNA helicase